MKCSVCNEEMEFHMVAKKGFFYKCPKCGLSKEHKVSSKNGKESRLVVIEEGFITTSACGATHFEEDKI